eukprot:g12822.t1
MPINIHNVSTRVSTCIGFCKGLYPKVPPCFWFPSLPDLKTSDPASHHSPARRAAPRRFDSDHEDLMPLSGCERLEVLDLERNLVSDLEDVRALSNCPLLRELNLSGNPVVQPAPKALPRERILELLPSLSVLDDVPTKPGTLGVGVPCRRFGGMA